MIKGEQAVTIEPLVTSERAERRYVYNGDLSPSELDDMQRGNHPVKKRKRSPFNIVAAIFIISLFIVLYVWNKIMVNRLAIEANDLQMQYQKVLYANETLRAEINKKSNLERIGKIAAEQLGMTYPKDQPVWFTFDQDSIHQ